MLSFFRRHKVLSGCIVLLGILFAVLLHRLKGPDRYYRIDFVKPAPGSGVSPGLLEVGVAKRDITPDLSKYDPWTDVDDNGRWDPKKDKYEDRNGNGRFDTVWMAGFSNDRPAKSVHDPLWARAIAFRNNGVTVVMVTIDSIGILQEKFIRVRRSLNPDLQIDHVMFSTTHNHEAPDTMGIWSNQIDSPVQALGVLIKPYFDNAYMDFVLKSCKEAIEEAVVKLQPAEMTLARVELDPEKFVKDTRKPIVHDKTLCCARFTVPGTDQTLATVVSVGNHAEALGSKNNALTSDFCGYLRDSVENGVPAPYGIEGLGGMCLFFQGMVGGLMTPLHLTVPHRDGTRGISEDSFEKAEALGQNLAIESVKALEGPLSKKSESSQVVVAAKTIYAPLGGAYKWAIRLGLIHPGWYWWDKARTEINVIRIGDLEILAVPGELYPEIAQGGIESPEGADYGIPPQEVPPLRPKMKGKVNMIVGLANDEVGYIIPKSQWDSKRPYAYGETKEPQYGEENSGGPELAPVIHQESLELMDRLHEALLNTP